MLGGGAVGLFCFDPTLTRHQCCDWSAVGEQNTRTIRQFDLGAGGGDLRDLHGSGGELESV